VAVKENPRILVKKQGTGKVWALTHLLKKTSKPNSKSTHLQKYNNVYILGLFSVPQKTSFISAYRAVSKPFPSSREIPSFQHFTNQSLSNTIVPGIFFENKALAFYLN
jgi:hypothetical protein